MTKAHDHSPVPPEMHAAADQPEAQASITHTVFELVRDIGIVICAALVVQTVAIQPFTIPSASMEPGLVVGDYIVVTKFAYGWSRASLPLNPPLASGRVFGRLPDRGDVVVFRRPSDPEEVWIKRAIALPGDRVEIKDGAVIVNNRPLARTAHDEGPKAASASGNTQRVEERQPGGRAYVTLDLGTGQPGDDRPSTVVPDGFIFVMGDHRDNSLDSRWAPDVGVGFLPVDNLVGRAEIVVASWYPGAGLLDPRTWLDLRPNRFLKRIR